LAARAPIAASIAFRPRRIDSNLELATFPTALAK
jgi:hypothetical protein